MAFVLLCEDCAQPATKQIAHMGCPFCGGAECGDYPEDINLCDACALGHTGEASAIQVADQSDDEQAGS